jgi:hypothetical protein
MNSWNAALLVNLLGFSVGIALYALLAVMVIRHRSGRPAENAYLLLLTTAALGLLWNTGELYSFVQKDFGDTGINPLLIAASFSALGFLPSVVVHSAQADEAGTHWLTYGAYGLSVFAAVVHFWSAFAGDTVPSDFALRSLTFGSLGMSAALLVFNLRQTLEKKAVWAAALLVFAVSALHLSGERESASWYIELIAHQSSLLLALVILFQNYRFAFADLFLKRAISLLLLAGMAFALYAVVAVPVLRLHETHEKEDVQRVAVILALWITTALAYPALHEFAVWLVDRIILRRADYAVLQFEIAREVESCSSGAEVLDLICQRLASALTAKRCNWTEAAELRSPVRLSAVEYSSKEVRLAIPAAEQPQYRIELRDFFGGRRLLSDEIELLENVALISARRIDILRVSEERFDQKFREQEFAKLATEAQLTALRSQINPHFLFNALTTLGHLIKTSPDKAYDTLLRLTHLLRGVLKSTGEFSTLGDEVKLVENYLDIERARFEERLRVTIDIPEELRSIKVPSLILQPVVENAIKHGISENKNGGEVSITASLHGTNGNSSLCLEVRDPGRTSAGSRPAASTGVGIRNICERLDSHYGKAANFSLETDGPGGTVARIEMPVEDR